MEVILTCLSMRKKTVKAGRSLKREKEKGIALRKELEAEVVSMREQMMAQTGESIELGEVRRELDQVMASKSQLNSEVARLQAENSSLMAEKRTRSGHGVKVAAQL